MADDDLDAELALFEQEIEATEPNPDSEENVQREEQLRTIGSGEQASQSTREPAKKKPLLRMEGNDAVVVASSEAVTVNVRPEWQEELLKRDAERILAQTTNNRGKPETVGAIQNTSRGSNATVEASPSGPTIGSSGGPGGATTAVAQGNWVWDGYQWVWDSTVQAKVSGRASYQEPWIAGEASELAAKGSSNSGTNTGGKKWLQPSGRKAGGRHVRAAAGSAWVDPSLSEWPDDDFRIFVGDLAPDATEDELKEAFSKYASYNMARVVVDKRTGEGKGYGFVSFGKGEDMVAALKEMNGKYVGSRPVKLRKSTWQKRELTTDRRRDMRVFKSSGLVQKQRRKK